MLNQNSNPRPRFIALAGWVAVVFAVLLLVTPTCFAADPPAKDQSVIITGAGSSSPTIKEQPITAPKITGSISQNPIVSDPIIKTQAITPTIITPPASSPATIAPPPTTPVIPKS